MWVTILIGSAAFINNTDYCTDGLGKAVSQWGYWFREDVTVPFISAAYNSETNASKICASASFSSADGYHLLFNRACPCIYQTAAIGHILHHSANTSWLPQKQTDILHIPLDPKHSYITYASTVALAPLGASRACRRSSDCTKNEHCERGHPGLCVATKPNVLWIVGMICILVPILVAMGCAASNWVGADTDKSDESMLLYAMKEPGAAEKPLTEPVEIAATESDVYRADSNA